MHVHEGTPEEALTDLRTSTSGLTRPEARRRLTEYGPNQVQSPPDRSLAMRFLRELGHTFARVLWVAAGLAMLGEFYQPGDGMQTLAWAIVAVILINAIFSFYQEYRAERAIAALENLLPHEVAVEREGVAERIPVTEVVPGDVVVLEEGDDAPADCRLLEAHSLRVSNAIITGESVPTVRDAAPYPGSDLIRSANVVMAGCSIVSGRARAVVFATGMNTELGRIARLTHGRSVPLSPLQREVVRLSRTISAISIGLGVTFFALGQTAGLRFWDRFMFAIGIIVANVPEGLLPTVTLALAIASQRIAKRNGLVRHLPAVETLGEVSVICSDKTGTLTLNRMVARSLHIGGTTVEVDALGRAPSALEPIVAELAIAAASCHNVHQELHNGQSGAHGDPMEIALVELATRLGVTAAAGPRIGEIPFDSRRRRLSTIHSIAGESVLICKGAPESVMPLCGGILSPGGREQLDSGRRARLATECASLARDGLRVLAFARRVLPATTNPEAREEELDLIGLVALEDPPRPEVPEAVRKCRRAGIRAVMITGDHARTAVAIARQTGLVTVEEPVVIEGSRLDRMSDVQLQIALDARELVFARTTPEQKLRIVQAFQRKGEVVAVTGDGVNDAPALRQADIGISMGRCGTEVARSSADIILLDDNFATIVAAIEEGRAVFANIRKFITYILTSNVPELVPYLAMVLARIPLALTILQILCIDLGTDIVPALGLGTEPPEPGLMDRPPRARNDHLLDAGLFARAYLFLGMMEAIAGMSLFWAVLRSGGWVMGTPLSRQDPLYHQATSACLAATVLMQVVNVFVCRSERESIASPHLKFNIWIVSGVAIELLLIGIIVYAPLAQRIFATAAFGSWVWIATLPFCLAMLLAEETRKWVLRLIRWRQSSPER
jgi:sodium/potassium-transporting ATPase subunit alpha